MKLSVVAKRYAKAFYDFALEKNKSSEFVSECQVLSHLVSGSSDLQQLIKFSPYSLPKRKKILLELIINPSEITLKMFDLLTQNNRLDIIQEILNQVLKMDLQAKGITKVSVTTAIKMEESLKRQIQKTMDTLIKGQIELINTIDPKIIGGFILNFGDLQYDASIINKVNNIKNTLVQT